MSSHLTGASLSEQDTGDSAPHDTGDGRNEDHLSRISRSSTRHSTEHEPTVLYSSSCKFLPIVSSLHAALYSKMASSVECVHWVRSWLAGDERWMSKHHVSTRVKAPQKSYVGQLNRDELGICPLDPLTFTFCQISTCLKHSETPQTSGTTSGHRIA